jgi:precorrin-2/cobalt-factor-2 C20-methyltransferase
MSGKFYGIGIGPGDPELLTLKSIRLLRSVDVVVVPESRSEKGSFALEIVAGHLGENTEILTLTFPMIKDEAEKVIHRRENSLKIKRYLDDGKDVAFLTIGDPMLYSTYIYMLEFLSGDDQEIETIPGITSFCAISSSLNMPLASQNQNIGIISLNKETDIESFILKFDNLVIMKARMDKDRLADILNKYKDNIDVVIATKCGTSDESISYDTNDLYGDIQYLTTVIVKKRYPAMLR